MHRTLPAESNSWRWFRPPWLEGGRNRRGCRIPSGSCDTCSGPVGRFVTLWLFLGTHLPQDLPAGRPAEPLSQPVEKPEPGEGGHGGAPGEEHVDQTHQQEAGREEPAGAQAVGQDTTDELTDGVGCGLAAGDEP